MNNSDDFFPSGILSLLPENHRFYFYLGITKLMEFPAIAEHLLEEFNKNEKYQSFVENTGIEPLKDINFIAISHNKNKENMKDYDYNFIVVINSGYDKERLLSHFEKKENGNDKVFVSIDTDQPLFLTFIQELILVFSNSEKIIEDIIDKNKSKGKKPGVFSNYVGKETILGVRLVIENEKKEENIFNIPFNIFKSLEFVSLFLHQEREDFIITAHLAYSDKEYVELVGGLVKGVTGILAKQVEFQEVKEFLENIQIQEELEGITLLLRLTKNNLDKLFEFLKEKKILNKKPVTGKEDQSKPDRAVTK